MNKLVNNKILFRWQFVLAWLFIFVDLYLVSLAVFSFFDSTFCNLNRIGELGSIDISCPIIFNGYSWLISFLSTFPLWILFLLLSPLVIGVILIIVLYVVAAVLSTKGDAIVKQILSEGWTSPRTVLLYKLFRRVFIFTPLILIIALAIIQIRTFSLKGEVSRHVNTVREESTIAMTTIGKEMCPYVSEDIFISIDSGWPRIHFPKGFADGVGYVFVSPENYWDGSLNKEADGKYMTNFDYADFLISSEFPLRPDDRGRMVISKKIKYDIRVVLIKDPLLQEEIRNKKIVLIDNYGGSFLKRLGYMSGEGEIPITFSPIFPEAADCATVAVQ